MSKKEQKSNRLVMVGSSVPQDVKAALEAIAKSEDRTVSWLIRRILERELKQQSQKPN